MIVDAARGHKPSERGETLRVDADPADDRILMQKSRLTAVDHQRLIADKRCLASQKARK